MSWFGIKKAAVAAPRGTGVSDVWWTLVTDSDASKAYSSALRQVISDVGATAACVYRLQASNSDHLQAEAIVSTDESVSFPVYVAISDGPAEIALTTGRYCSTFQDRGGPHQETSEQLSLITIPLLCGPRTEFTASESESVGLLQVATVAPGGFTSDQVDLLKGYAGAFSATLATARLQEFTHKTVVDALAQISLAIESKDSYSAGHSSRVSVVALAIGAGLNLETAELDQIRIGAILMDIGQVAIPDSILKSAAALTTEERQLLSQHPVIGYEICSELRLPQEILAIVRGHHERLDGSGYPDGLRGAELSTAVRIVCIADAFDAMLSDRRHRAKMELSEAIDSLMSEAGKKFDRQGVFVLKELAELGKFRHLYGDGRASGGLAEAA